MAASAVVVGVMVDVLIMAMMDSVAWTVKPHVGSIPTMAT